MKLPIKELILCIALVQVASVQAVEVSGAKIDETVQAANTTLKLNGAGTRTKLFFKVYVAALYVVEPKTTLEEVVAEAGPKQINLTMLREISSDILGDAFMSGVKKNTSLAERAKLTNQFINFGQLFSTVPELKKGDVIAIQWVPNVGSIMSINGKKIGETFPDIAFFNAILRIWLGANPVENNLKTQMLGGAK